MILNKDAAKSLVIKILQKRGFQIQSVKKVNHGRHIMLFTQSQNFYLLYKTEPLHSFNHLHSNYTRKPNTFKGHGETINYEWLRYAMKHNCLLLYVYESDPFNKEQEDRIYWIHPKKIKDFCEEHKLLRPHEKPTTEQIPHSRSVQSFNEVTYDFPIALLERFNN